MAIKITLDPIGQAIAVPGLDAQISKFKEVWNNLKIQLGKVEWHVAVNYITQCLDDLIIYMVQHDIPGQDKKATVLNAIGQVYDYVIAPMIPIWVRPFSSIIKNYVVNIVFSSAIDWIVSKYQNGSWKIPTTSAIN